MAKYTSFTHVERLDKPETEGILMGICYITPKMDGTNAAIWFEDGDVKAGSRKRQVTIEDDNAGFAAWVYSEDEEAILLKKLLSENPDIILYGEFGCGKVAHIKDYDENTANKMWIFDAYDFVNHKYLHPLEVKALLEKYGLKSWTLPMVVMENPTYEQLKDLAQQNNFRLCHANHPGEGVVIRNPDFINKYGKYTIAKLVLDEYIQEQKKKARPKAIPGEVEKSIVDIYLTESELAKAKHKTILACGASEFDIKSGKMIGMYLNIAYHDAIIEETGAWLKKFRNPTIDFSLMDALAKTKARHYIGL